jgi:hypothetical protein
MAQARTGHWRRHQFDRPRDSRGKPHILSWLLDLLTTQYCANQMCWYFHAGFPIRPR